jgi:hypothetical protein
MRVGSYREERVRYRGDVMAGWFHTHTVQQLQITTVLTTREVAEVRCCCWWFLKAHAHISPGSARVGG